MTLLDRVKRLVKTDETNKSGEIDWYRISDALCKRYGWDFFTLQEQPIPFVYALQIAMMEEVVQERKNYTKQRGIR